MEAGFCGRQGRGLPVLLNAQCKPSAPYHILIACTTSTTTSTTRGIDSTLDSGVTHCLRVRQSLASVPHACPHIIRPFRVYSFKTAAPCPTHRHPAALALRRASCCWLGREAEPGRRTSLEAAYLATAPARAARPGWALPPPPPLPPLPPPLPLPLPPPLPPPPPPGRAHPL